MASDTHSGAEAGTGSV